ncbi:MAG: helicase C-terminal domain-containing protein [Candidatus Hodarchaeales archaeon]
MLQLNPWPHDIFSLLRLRFHRIILLSGTFHNLQAYTKYYGLDQHPAFTCYSVPIPPLRSQQLFFGTYYHQTVSSKLEHRTPELYQHIADIIQELAFLAGDHTLVFVPSYEFLTTLFPILEDRFQGHLPLYQEPVTGRIPFLSQLFTAPPSVVVGVYGGKFNEGIEIRHPTSGRSRVRLVLLVGLPFPPPTPQNTFLKQLYAHTWISPFVRWALIGRRLHTMVQQCLGRTIRSNKDFGAAVILDYRALKYLRLPNHRIFRTRQQLSLALTRALVRVKKH